MSYIIEYAKSGRSRCRGPIALCHSSNHTISKDELRLGVEVENIKGVSWKHWTCVSPEVLSNMKESLSTPDIMKGWENLKEEDKEKIKEAWELGDIPNRPQPANKSPRRGKRKSSADADEIKSDEIKSDE
ncbi:hypothetical protein BDB01DRAFT_850195 [Pilobolus umbonatus]|nr:hypothetical protein BDB01DRAFT_850195 [Pilobolus umbonatus]